MPRVWGAAVAAAAADCVCRNVVQVGRSRRERWGGWEGNKNEDLPWFSLACVVIQ